MDQAREPVPVDRMTCHACWQPELSKRELQGSATLIRQPCAGTWAQMQGQLPAGNKLSDLRRFVDSIVRPVSLGLLGTAAAECVPECPTNMGHISALTLTLFCTEVTPSTALAIDVAASMSCWVFALLLNTTAPLRSVSTWMLIRLRTFSLASSALTFVVMS